MMVHENYINQIGSQTANIFHKLDSLVESILSIVEGDIIDKTMYNNQSWHLQPIHALNACHIPSYYVSKYPKKNPPPIEFTAALGKNSMQCANRKTIGEISTFISNGMTYQTEDIQMFSRMILHLLIHSKDANDRVKGCSMLKQYHLGIDKLERLIKMDRLSNCKTMYTSHLKTQFKKIYGDIDDSVYSKNVKTFGKTSTMVSKQNDDVASDGSIGDEISQPKVTRRKNTVKKMEKKPQTLSKKPITIQKTSSNSPPQITETSCGKSAPRHHLNIRPRVISGNPKNTVNVAPSDKPASTIRKISITIKKNSSDEDNHTRK